jgi:hypothetical protein
LGFHCRVQLLFLTTVVNYNLAGSGGRTTVDGFYRRPQSSGEVVCPCTEQSDISHRREGTRISAAKTRPIQNWGLQEETEETEKMIF